MVQMDYKCMIIHKLTQYLSREIQREELCEYATDMIHKMLRGDIFILKNLEIWGILTEISGIDDADDFYCDDTVKHCYEVLKGIKNTTFTFAMHIPKEYTGDSFPEIEEMLVEYKKGKDFSTDAMLKLKAIMERKVDIVTTLNDMIESQIIDLLKLGYTFYDEEGNNAFLIKSTVFISDEKAMLSEEKLLDKIFTLLECYRGKRSFFVQIIYREGRGNVSILV